MSDRRKMATLYAEEKKRSDELAAILRDEKNKVKVSWQHLATSGHIYGHN